MEPEPKRPRRTRTRLTFAQKAEILHRLSSGEKQVELSQELGCSKRAISRLKQDRHYFEQLHLNPSDSDRKSRRAVRHVILEKRLHDFFSLANLNGFPVTSATVCRAAICLRDMLLADHDLSNLQKSALRSFQASPTWSKAFIKRSDLHSFAPSPYASPRDDRLNAIRELKLLLSQYDLDCILTVDRANFFHNLLPRHAATSSVYEQYKRHSNIHTRNTLLIASNTTGTLKIPITFISNEKSPHCFRERSSRLPYLYHQCAWVDRPLFRAWFYSIFLPAVRKYTDRHVALILNENWSADDIADNRGQVTIITVAPHLTDAAQKVMSRSIMSMLRRMYRYDMIRLITHNRLSPQLPLTSLPHKYAKYNSSRLLALSLYDAVELIYISWEAIPAEFIARCWLETAILPEQHVTRLYELHGRHVKGTTTEMFFSLIPDSRRVSMKEVETLIQDGQEGNMKMRENTLINLSALGHKTLSYWLDYEDTANAQNLLSAEMEEIIIQRGPILTSDLDENFSNEISKFSAARDVPLPNAACIRQLLAPIQSIVNECQSGRANVLLYELKQELSRVWTMQEQQAEKLLKERAIRREATYPAPTCTKEPMASTPSGTEKNLAFGQPLFQSDASTHIYDHGAGPGAGIAVASGPNANNSISLSATFHPLPTTHTGNETAAHRSESTNTGSREVDVSQSQGSSASDGSSSKHIHAAD